MQKFADWLGQLLQQNALEVQCLLSDETAMHFLLAWSLFESKCFLNDLTPSKLSGFVDEIVACPRVALEPLGIPAAHFHRRYQDKRKFTSLMPRDKTPTWMIDEFKTFLCVPYAQLTQNQTIKLVAFVVFRFRNNIFHGAKGVNSWLKYRKQIQLCINAMQTFISHGEEKSPSMRILDAGE